MDEPTKQPESMEPGTSPRGERCKITVRSNSGDFGPWLHCEEHGSFAGWPDDPPPVEILTAADMHRTEHGPEEIGSFADVESVTIAEARLVVSILKRWWMTHEGMDQEISGTIWHIQAELNRVEKASE